MVERESDHQRFGAGPIQLARGDPTMVQVVGESARSLNAEPAQMVARDRPVGPSRERRFPTSCSSAALARSVRRGRLDRTIRAAAKPWRWSARGWSQYIDRSAPVLNNAATSYCSTGLSGRASVTSRKRPARWRGRALGPFTSGGPG